MLCMLYASAVARRRSGVQGSEQEAMQKGALPSQLSPPWKVRSLLLW